MAIDHIIPQSLSDHPGDLRQLRIDYDIDDNIPNFQINDFCNWVPAHPHCNTRKGAQVFPKKLTLLLLQEVQRSLPRVRRELETVARQRSMSHLLGSLAVALEKEHVEVQEVQRLVRDVEKRRHADEPLVITFGLTIEDVLESDLLPPIVPREYPYLCDWLEQRLVAQLHSIISTPFHYTQASARSGECLSVRIVFPGVDLAELEGFHSPWWQILEAANFWDIFGEGYASVFPEQP